MEREIVWGVAVTAPLQKGAADKHCFGDCGKISMAGAINDELTGGLFVCCQPTCPLRSQGAGELRRDDELRQTTHRAPAAVGAGGGRAMTIVDLEQMPPDDRAAIQSDG